MSRIVLYTLTVMMDCRSAKASLSAGEWDWLKARVIQQTWYKLQQWPRLCITNQVCSSALLHV